MSRTKAVILAVALLAPLGCGLEDDPQPAGPGEAGGVRQPLTSCPAVPKPPQPITQASFGAWKNTVEQVLQCLKQNHVGAAKLQALLELLEKEQEAMENALEQELQSTLGKLENTRATFEQGLRDRILEDGLEARGPATVELGETRLWLTQLDKLINRYQKKMKQAQARYAALAKQAVAYRDTEPTVLAELKQLAQDASSAGGFTQLAQAQQGLVEMSRREAKAGQAVKLEAYDLMRALEHDIAELEKEIALFRPMMKKEKIKEPDLAGEAAVATLKNLVGYCERRGARFSGAVDRLLSGIDARGKALAAQKVDAETQATLRQAAELAANTEFRALVQARVDRLLQMPPKSQKLKLSYLGDRYNQCHDLLKLEPLCQGAKPRPRYMEGGCILLDMHADKARNQLKTTLPALIKGALPMLQNAGVSPTLIQSIQVALGVGHLEGAIMRYDMALHISDGEGGLP